MANFDGGPISLDDLVERLKPTKRVRTIKTTTGFPYSNAGPKPEIPIPDTKALTGDAAELFLGLADRYKTAQDQNKLTAWQGVRDYIMENFDGLIMTRLVSFRDLMNAAVDIDQKILKGREDLKADPLALYEKWWTKPDVEDSNGPPSNQTQD